MNSIKNNNFRKTPIQNFYAGQILFLTGATGFLGKILLDKLLRSCPDVAKIYVLIRSKKEIDINKRIDDAFSNPVFDRMKKEVPNYRQKIVAVAGDSGLPNLGLSPHIRKTLIDEVNIVFHVAATVNFDESLKQAMKINTTSVSMIIDLCKEMKNLKGVIYVSTAYSNCYLEEEVDEKIYDHPYKYEDLRVVANTLPDNIINDIFFKILDKWPNTYTFSKALAEQVVKEKCGDLPIGIFRPSIITAAVDEPVSGWVDNYYGPMSLTRNAMTGVLHFFWERVNAAANIVPVDYVANGLLASAWDVASRTDRRGENILIYNYVAPDHEHLYWSKYFRTVGECLEEYPAEKAIWSTSLSFHENPRGFFINHLFYNVLLPRFLDIINTCLGKKSSFLIFNKKSDEALKKFEPFLCRGWRFNYNNVQQMWARLDPRDKVNYKFTFENFDWIQYFKLNVIGIKTFLLREDMNNIENARARIKKLRWINEGVKLFCISLIPLIIGIIIYFLYL